MKYFVSDIHGEYDLFLCLLDKIRFGVGDEMIVLGDMIDKGEKSVSVLKYIYERDNIHPILGNHEHAFLKYYHSILADSPEDFDSVLSRLREYFPRDGYLLNFEIVDWLEQLPYYVEGDGYICVHAGLPVADDGSLIPPEKASAEQLVNDRRFMNPSLKHNDSRCVLFGHTQTDCIYEKPRIIGYRRPGGSAQTISDFYKIHLDTGSWSNGILGCFCLDTLDATYVRK